MMIILLSKDHFHCKYNQEHHDTIQSSMGHNRFILLKPKQYWEYDQLRKDHNDVKDQYSWQDQSYGWDQTQIFDYLFVKHDKDQGLY